MKNSIALITGGSAGLGLALAKQMALKGHEVLIISRNASKLANTTKQINQDYPDPRVHSFAADVSTVEGVRSIFDHLQKRKYHPAYLFNNAGVGHFFDLKNYQEEWIDHTLTTNLRGSILLCAELMRFVGKEPATIVNIISSLALKTMPQAEVYSASKWGLRGFTNSLQDSTRGTNIRVMGVYPGRFKSAFWKEEQIETDKDKFMDVKDLAKVIVDNVLQEGSAFVRDLVLGAW